MKLILRSTVLLGVIGVIGYGFHLLSKSKIENNFDVVENGRVTLPKEIWDANENNVSSISILLQAANSISGDDVKLTERLTIPYSRLRGFERGKVGPKDGSDFVGGNYISALNINSSLPGVFQNIQNLDALIFFDAANVWGVDYDSSIDDASKIRSSTGIALDFLTPVGPLSFSLSQPISKQTGDVTESFRFNLGTTF